MNDSGVKSDTDSDIDHELPTHPKGFKNHWAAIMKAMDEEDEHKKQQEHEHAKKKQAEYRLALESQIKANNHQVHQLSEFDSKTGQKERDKMLFDMKKSENLEKSRQMNKKKREMAIARENMQAYSARKDIRKKNIVDEDQFLKNYMQENMRKEAQKQNKNFTKHKMKEIEVREFNKNIIMNKNSLKMDNFQIRDKDSMIYGYRGAAEDVVLDPILEAGEKR